MLAQQLLENHDHNHDGKLDHSEAKGGQEDLHEQLVETKSAPHPHQILPPSATLALLLLRASCSRTVSLLVWPRLSDIDMMMCWRAGVEEALEDLEHHDL